MKASWNIIYTFNLRSNFRCQLPHSLLVRLLFRLDGIKGGIDHGIYFYIVLDIINHSRLAIIYEHIDHGVPEAFRIGGIWPGPGRKQHGESV